jgi:hypothetical protein
MYNRRPERRSDSPRPTRAVSPHQVIRVTDYEQTWNYQRFRFALAARLRHYGGDGGAEE